MASLVWIVFLLFVEVFDGLDWFSPEMDLNTFVFRFLQAPRCLDGLFLKAFDSLGLYFCKLSLVWFSLMTLYNDFKILMCHY